MAIIPENPKIPRITYSEEDNDRISNLPIPILHHILSSLDTLDVIRLSAVSRQWRYLWLSMPCLYFDIFHKVWSDKMKTLSLLAVNDQFKDFVNWVLMSQNRSVNIKKIWLNCLNSDDDYTIYRWINVMTRRNVEDLNLVIFLGTEIPIELPHCLITCESLISLKICFGRHTVVKLPPYGGFRRLKYLFLLNVELPNYISFRIFISSCPFLENLNLHAIKFRDFKTLEISSTSLKKLVIDNNGISGANGDGLKNCELRIACPSLSSFSFIGPLPRDFTLQDIKSLWNVFFGIECLAQHATVEECHPLICKIFKGLCNIKVLKLSVHNWECEISKWEAPDQAIPCLTYHVKVVELFEVNGRQNELELVRFLLKHGQVLQKMSINWAIDIKDAEEIIPEIMNFPKTSSEVALKFLVPKFQFEFSEL
ncbi:F-box/LRR-repeat protein At3g58900-like isoform X2 [Pistacia vera]|uniref:F-box/LRR-repeat protein At3g58900-like isoform X2 n=1 Tax=Pistacia vera TaxID=55513 RepID=UPI0012631D60|nr:F-box/LRR-repeat protein At3g58900-like isoform X2 [Pistacia vera]